jgi:hypothetical protein
MYVWRCCLSWSYTYIRISLCWIFLTLIVADWTPTPLWCRLAGWERIVTVSFSRMALEPTHLLPLPFGVLSNGALIRIVGILFMLSDYVWGTLSSFQDIFIRRYDIWHLCCWDLFSAMTWYFMMSFHLCWMMKSSTLICSFNCLNYYLKIVCGVYGVIVDTRDKIVLVPPIACIKSWWKIF